MVGLGRNEGGSCRCLVLLCKSFIPLLRAAIELLTSTVFIALDLDPNIPQVMAQLQSTHDRSKHRHEGHTN